MDYESYESLDELLEDSDAAEFRDLLPEIPVPMSRDELAAWDGPSWGSEYQDALDAFKRLMRAAPDYGAAMLRVGELQDELASAADQAPDQTPDQTPEEDQEPVLPPAEAVAEVTEAITVPAIQALQDQFPDVVARFTPEQIRAAAMAATAAAVHESGH